MKTLLLLRHAKSSWANAGLHDHDRPLNKRGMRDAPRMARVMLEAGLCPEVILSSAALRARTTAEAFQSACPGARLEVTEELYLAQASEYIAALSALADEVECAMAVGHNPGIGDLVQRLGGAIDAMPTAALACIELPVDSWAQLGPETRGRLAGFWTPKTTDIE